MRAVQPKLTVNTPGDSFEQEADAVAGRVMRSSPAVALSLQPSSGGALQRSTTEEEEPIQRSTAEEEEEESVQRKTEKEEDEKPIQRKGAGQPTVSPATAATIRSPGAGSPLPSSVRSRVEPHVGANLSGVRVHTGPSAHRAAASLNARAFTHGSNIFLNRAESSSNVGLMAHEATHVVQQGAAPVQRQPVGQGHPPIHFHSPPSVQRLLPSIILNELDDYARQIPGYTLFTVIIGFNPLTGEGVDRNATNLLAGLMGLVPFGTYVFDKLQEHGILQSAFTWVQGELRRLDLSIERIERTLNAAWTDVRLAESFDYNLAVLRRHFGGLYNDVVAFATSLVNHIIELIKEAVVSVAERLLAENRAWALIKKILHHDPLRDQPVEATTVEILEDFLRLIGKEQELEQMRERGTLEETAAWIDTQIGTFRSLLGELRGLITDAWNAIQPENLPQLTTNLQNLASRAGSFLERVWTFATTVAAKVLELIKHVLLGLLRDHARGVPGYPLLTVLLGKDPFTQEVVPRNATNLIRGFMSLMPNGEQQFQQMQETGVIPEAAQRIETAMTTLGITWPFVQQLFIDIWNSFTINDLIHPIDAFIRILTKFEEPLNRLFTFVIEVIKVVLELVLVLMNFPSDLIASIIANAIQAFDDIQRDPVGFLINLLETAKLGFQKFFDNILEHLLGGLTDWLFSTVREAGIEPPADFTFESILGFVLDVLGLSMDHMWELLANHIGQENVDRIRGAIDRVMQIAREAWGFIQDVQERGMVAVWEYIESQLTSLWDTVLQQVKDYVMERVINVGMRWLMSLLDATGITPVINSFVAFFNAIQSAIQYLREMLEVVNNFVSTVASIARGDIEPGAAQMEQGLRNSIPIVIGFIANQLGLGDLGQRLGEVIESVRGLVDQALNWLIEQALRLGQAVLRSLGLGGEESAGADPTDHPTMARQAANELTQTEGQPRDYEALRSQKEQQARQIEQRYTDLLEPGIALRIIFISTSTDQLDNDIDFRIIIAPNTTTIDNSIPIPGTIPANASVIVAVLSTKQPRSSEIPAPSVPRLLTPTSSAHFELDTTRAIAQITGLPVEPNARFISKRRPSGVITFGAPPGFTADSSGLLLPPAPRLFGSLSSDTRRRGQRDREEPRFDARAGDLRQRGIPRHPDALLITPSQVEPLEFTLDASMNVRESPRAVPHKLMQIPGTIEVILRNFSRQTPVVYTVFVRSDVPQERLIQLEAELKRLGENVDVTVIFVRR